MTHDAPPPEPSPPSPDASPVPAARRVSRRRFLGAGSLGLLAAAGGAGWLYAREPATPWYLTGGTEDVRLSYAYAVDHPEVLRHIPCFCGCGESEGHQSVLDCFVAGHDLFGRVRYKDHGVSCRLCVAVVRETSDRLAAGASLPAVRAEIDRLFSPYANWATDTPHPAGHGD